jgi:hypothetical protein
LPVVRHFVFSASGISVPNPIIGVVLIAIRNLGLWRLWLYAVCNPIPGLDTNANVDCVGILIILAFLQMLQFLPFITILNTIPQWLGFYRLVWRMWYRGPIEAPRTADERMAKTPLRE